MNDIDNLREEKEKAKKLHNMGMVINWAAIAVWLAIVLSFGSVSFYWWIAIMLPIHFICGYLIIKYGWRESDLRKQIIEREIQEIESDLNVLYDLGKTIDGCTSDLNKITEEIDKPEKSA